MRIESEVYELTELEQKICPLKPFEAGITSYWELTHEDAQARLEE